MQIQTSEEKLDYVKKYLYKLINIAERAVSKDKYNLALAVLSAYCRIQYSINQVYTDSRAENLLLQISEKTVSVPENYQGEENTILFYDGFGFDLRGWAASYARAISSLGYNYVYVAPLHAKGKIPHIKAEVENGRGRIEYVDMRRSYMKHINALNGVFNQYKPKAAFFYTTPNDVAGAAVFDRYAGKVRRIQIDLTDHAFWIGTNAFDYVTECRLPGASNLVHYRGISEDNIVKTDCPPYVNRDIESVPFPFDIEKEKYFFSGGALYKTLGDSDLLFYKMVSLLLEENPDTLFLFAGKGDNSEIVKLADKFENRVYYIHERADFIRLFENCVFFLNTYPMFGGLMMRYAALTGKVPLTLKHNEDHAGLLNEQEKRGIEFNTVDEIVREGSRLLRDEMYRRKKAEDMVGACLSEEDFAKNLQGIIEVGSTGDYFEKIDKIDTSVFRAEYIKRLNVSETVENAVATMMNKSLLTSCPLLFVRKGIRKVIR